jgi:hypothetical protein
MVVKHASLWAKGVERLLDAQWGRPADKRQIARHAAVVRREHVESTKAAQQYDGGRPRANSPDAAKERGGIRTRAFIQHGLV